MVLLGVVALLLVAGLVVRAALRRHREDIDRQLDLIQRLTERVYWLEVAQPKAVTQQAQPKAAAPPEQPEAAAPPEQPPEQPPVQLPVQPPVQPEPAAPREEWEAVVGGSWLNKLGVLVTVIGLALFLRYSLTELGPAGRVAVGVALSLSMLGAGVGFERLPRYVVYGRGLIGGGWAGLYFTTYAMHALEAARVITSPIAGMLLLSAVAAGMIAHSLRYRSQTVSGIAFFVGFLTLEVSPLYWYSPVASVPLLVALLFVARRNGWIVLAAGGAAFTYATHAIDFHGFDSARYYSPIGEPILWVYWLLIEAFDLAAMRGLFPLNALGLITATVLTWPREGAMRPDWFLTAAAAAYLASAFVRLRLRPERDEEAVESLAGGGFSSAIVLSAGLAAAALIDRFTGVRLTWALLFEGEILILAGWMYRRRMLEWLGSVVLALPLAYLLFDNFFIQDKVFALGREWHQATAPAAAMAALFYLNRFRFGCVVLFSYAASMTAAVTIGHEVLPPWQALAWTLAAVPLAWFGREGLRLELGWQAAGMAVLSVGSLFADMPRAFPWLTIGIPAAIYYGAVKLLGRSPIAAGAASTAGGAFLAVLLFRVLPEVWLGAGWTLMAVVLWTWGLVYGIPVMRRQGAVMALVGFARSFRHSGQAWEEYAACAAVAALLYFAQFAPPRSEDGWERWLRPGYSLLATARLTVLVNDLAQDRVLTMAWSVESILLVAAGFFAHERVLRLSGLALFLFCLFKLFFHDLRELDTLSRIFSFLVLGLLLLAASWAYTRFREQISKYL